MPQTTTPPGHTDPAPQDLIATLQAAGYNVLAQTIKTIIQEFPDKASAFWQERVQGWMDELAGGAGRTEDDIRDDVFQYIVTPDDLMNKYGMTADQAHAIILGGNEGGQNFSDFLKDYTPAPVTTPVLDEAPPEEQQDEQGVGGPQGDMTILTSQSMEWFFDPQTGKWHVSYKLPNSDRRVFFQADPDQMNALFGEGLRPANYESIDFNSLAQREGYTFAGGIGEVSGTGSFESMVDTTIALALDEGTLPAWAKADGAVLDLLYIATSEQKGTEWLIEQIAKLPSFKERFPGIEAMTSLGLTLPQAIGGFLEFETGVKSVLQRAGRNVDEVTPDLVGQLLSTGQSLEDVSFVFGEFKRLEDNAGALAAFNEVLAARGLDPLDEDGQLEFLAGNAPGELYDIWEEASFNQAAQEAGLSLSVGEAMDLAGRTVGATPYDAAYNSLNQAAQNILRFRTDLALDRYDLDQDDLIDLSLGIAPRSGRSQAEIARNVERALSAARAGVDGPRKQPFRSFTSEGTPQAASLSKTRTKR